MTEAAGADDILRDASDRMTKSVHAFHREIDSIRTGRATPALLDGFTVDYFGVKTALNQLATIIAPEARLLTVQPWDRSLLSVIEKEIMKSDLGLTPSNDGAIIRLPIPVLTEERRRDLVKRLKRTLEDKRVAIRNVRRDGLEHLRRLEKDGGMSEDALRRTQERLQKVTDEQIAEAEQVSAKKEAELMEV